MHFYVFPQASPSGIHKTALRVQILYTLEAHGTSTIYYMPQLMLWSAKKQKSTITAQ